MFLAYNHGLISKNQFDEEILGKCSHNMTTIVSISSSITQQKDGVITIYVRHCGPPLVGGPVQLNTLNVP